MKEKTMEVTVIELDQEQMKRIHDHATRIQCHEIYAGLVECSGRIINIDAEVKYYLLRADGKGHINIHDKLTLPQPITSDFVRGLAMRNGIAVTRCKECKRLLPLIVRIIANSFEECGAEALCYCPFCILEVKRVKLKHYHVSYF